MKILWFADTPCLAAEILDNNIHHGGWLQSLEEQIVQRDDIELSVCFYWGEELKAFKYKKTTYYPVLRKIFGSKILRVVARALEKSHNDKKELKELLSVIDMVQPDVIHIHGTEDNFGLIQPYTKIPIVISIQGILSPYSEKYFSGIPFILAYWYEGLISKILFRSVRRQYYDIKNSAVRERRILSQTKYIMGRTDWDKRITRILAPESLYYFSNEILRPSFYEKQWDKKQFSKPIQIVTTLSGSLYKGLETIVNTSRILEENRILSFEWTIVGLSEYSELVRIVRRWLKADFESLHIKLVGSINQNELVSILLKSDIYCQVSHIENSSNSLCEAMLLGIPAIATYVGGTASLLTNKKEGILVQEGEPYSYAGAIYELAHNFKLATEYAKAARERALKRHAKNQIINNLFSIYQTVLNNRA